jgi:lipopolysaccharide transport system permease protein
MRLLRRVTIVYQHHELLTAFVQKDFDSRYAGSVLGVLWTQLYPLLLLAVYSFVFSNIFHNDIPKFPLFLFVGIAIWTFFSSSTLMATGSILSSANLVAKVNFPRELIIVSTVLMACVDLLASQVVLLVGALLFGVPPTWSWAALPLLLLLLALFSAGLGLTLATAAVYLRDVRYFVEVGTLLLMFMSPVFYSEEMIPSSLAWLARVNPLAVVIVGYRHAFLDGIWPSLESWAALAGLAMLALLVGFEVFDRGQQGFPDAF